MKFNSGLHEISVIFKNTFLIIALFSTLISVAAHSAEKKTLLVLGDSLSAGYGLGPNEGFPEQLGEVLEKQGIEVTIINAGVSGDTSSGGLARLDWSVGKDVDAVILELGANDALRGISPDLTRDNLETIVSRLKERGISVLLTGMKAPPNMGEEYGIAFNNIYPELAKKHSLAFYPFFLEGVAAQPELNQRDGIHPTKEGIAKIVAGILPIAVKFLTPILTN